MATKYKITYLDGDLKGRETIVLAREQAIERLGRTQFDDLLAGYGSPYILMEID